MDACHMHPEFVTARSLVPNLYGATLHNPGKGSYLSSSANTPVLEHSVFGSKQFTI